MIDPGPVLLPAAMAGGVAIAATVAIERWGGRLGGLLGTLPSTIVPAALGIAASSPDPADFQVAMWTTPAGMLVNALFLWTWRVVPRRLPPSGNGTRLAAMIAISMAAWAAAALVSRVGLDQLRRWPDALATSAVLLTLALVVVGVAACTSAPPAPKGKQRVGPLTLAARGLLAAVAIGVAVVLAQVGGPIAAGLAAVFPAIFLTTMVSLWLSQGQAVQIGAVSPMMLGSGSVSAFAVLAAWAVPAMGPAAGTATAWLGAVGLVTAPAALWLRRRGRTP